MATPLMRKPSERAEPGPGVSMASRSAPGSDPDRRCVCNPSIEAERNVLLDDGGLDSDWPITTAATPGCLFSVAIGLVEQRTGEAWLLP
jgi:hypothetical protein